MPSVYSPRCALIWVNRACRLPPHALADLCYTANPIQCNDQVIEDIAPDKWFVISRKCHNLDGWNLKAGQINIHGI